MNLLADLNLVMLVLLVPLIVHLVILVVLEPWIGNQEMSIVIGTV